MVSILTVSEGCSRPNKTPSAPSNPPIATPLPESGVINRPDVDTGLPTAKTPPRPFVKGAEMEVFTISTLAEDEAIKMIKKHSGKFSRDPKIAGNPIVRVEIRNGNVTDSDFKKLAELRNITSLKMSVQKSVTNVGVQELSALANLTELSLSLTQSSSRSRATDAGFSYISNLKHLQSITIENGDVTDAILSEIAKLTNLTYLSLHNTLITDAGTKEISKLTTLSSLDLTATKITDAGAKDIIKITNLSSLKLNRTKVSDDGLQNIGKLSGLTNLELDYTGVSDAGRTHQSLPKVGSQPLRIFSR